MRKLLFLLAFIPSLLFAQEYEEITVFDMSGVTTDTTRPISLKPLNKVNGRLIEVDFTSVNCDLLELNIGYSVSDIHPMYLDTIPSVQLPLTLDKTVYTNTYLGVETNAIGLDISPYNGGYLWINIATDVTCTSGEVKLRYAK